MPAPLNVDKEQVRMLVLSVGVTETARQTGIDLNTVKQWSARGKWLAHTRQQPQLPVSMQPTNVTGVTKPADALVNVLSERHATTRANLSRYVVKASEAAADHPEPLEIAQNVRHVAGVVSAIWPEEQDRGLSIQVLNVNGSMG